ncbi:MAG: OsmC family protein [Oligoflexia bacterium]|nr:OsmC family protein [Oligoflexia bacterium]
MKLKMDWKRELAFDAHIDGHTVAMDTSAKGGGGGTAPTPKQLVLAGLAGCTGMDVVHILGRMRVQIDSFDLEADAHQTDGQPAVFDEIRLVYRLEGPELLPAKVLEAVELSQTKYCGVSAMISRSARISYEVIINGQLAGTGTARFT